MKKIEREILGIDYLLYLFCKPNVGCVSYFGKLSDMSSTYQKLFYFYSYNCGKTAEEKLDGGGTIKASTMEVRLI